MTRRGLSLTGALACIAALISAPAASAQDANICQIKATATFTKALGVGPADFAYTLSGRLDNCKQPPGSSGPTGGIIEAGKIYTAPNGKQYREPGLSGNGSCLPGGQSGWKGGTLFIRWDGGGITLLPAGGAGQGPLIQWQGDAALDSVVLQPVDPNDDPLIVSTSLFKGYSSIGATATQYDSPADCAGTGVKSATISGAFGPYHF